MVVSDQALHLTTKILYEIHGLMPRLCLSIGLLLLLSVVLPLNENSYTTILNTPTALYQYSNCIYLILV